jgi:hypothetical protein
MEDEGDSRMGIVSNGYSLTDDGGNDELTLLASLELQGRR